MKKVFKYASFLAIGGAIAFTSCSKKSDDPTPTTDTPTGPACTGGSVKTIDVLVDASTVAGTAESKGKGFSGSITKCDGTANLALDIKARSNVSKVYILKSQDNGNSTPVTFTNTLTTNNGKSLTSNNATYSYDLPSGIDAFKVTIPVSVRNSDAAVTDVYTIWLTSGTGDFANTGKKTIVGPFTVTLNYKTPTVALLTASGIVVGSQQATEPSYVTTIGTIGTLSGVKLGEDLTGDEKVTALNSVDFNFVTLSADGTDLGSVPYLISVNERAGVNFTGNIEGTAVTHFAPYTGDFAAATSSTLAALNAGTATKIAVTAGNTYSYVTQDGRKGLVKVNTISAGTGGGSKASLDIKVLASK